MKNLIKEKYDIIVAGGGASGMMAACFCAAGGKKVCIIEKNKKLGRKLSATGNGKCNLTNREMKAEKYPEGDTTFVENLLQEYTVDKILNWFEGIGIICKDRAGYLYPMSEQAQSVTGALEAELNRLKVEVLLENEIESLKKNNELFEIETISPEGRRCFTAKQVILALGGPAAPVYGAGLKAYELLKLTGHKQLIPTPALCPLTVSEKLVKQLAGVRLDAAITLELSGKSYKEQGEIIFAADGVSGIPVFQISRYVTRAEKLNNCKLHIDLLPKLEEKELKTALLQLSNKNPELTLEYLFRGILNYKAVYYLMLDKGFKPEKIVKGIKAEELEKLIRLFKNFTLTVNGAKGFEHAQVSTGGLELSEVHMESLESKRVKGLYITGESLNVDGNCGGYNLHLAWATGMKAGRAAGEAKNA